MIKTDFVMKDPILRNFSIVDLAKGGLISRSFSVYLAPNCAKHCPQNLLFRWIEHRICSDLAHFLGDWSQSQKLSEIKKHSK